jgi:hypothetical protein
MVLKAGPCRWRVHRAEGDAMVDFDLGVGRIHWALNMVGYDQYAVEDADITGCRILWLLGLGTTAAVTRS